MSAAFDPDWCIRPGETLREWMDDQRLTPKTIGVMCGRMPEEWIDGILAGTRRITPNIADGLELGTSIPARLWLRLEAHYRAGLKAGKKEVT